MHTSRGVTENEHEAGSMVLAVTSMSILLPVLMAFAARESELSKLPPMMRKVRLALILLGVCACAASAVAWFSWNFWRGLLDQMLATLSVTGTAAFGCARRDWVSKWCAVSFAICALLFYTRGFNEQCGWPQPWPHFTFRVFAIYTCVAGLTGGLYYETPMQLSIALGILTPVCYAHAQFELMMELQSLDSVFKRSHFLEGVARTLFMVLFDATLMLVLPIRLSPSRPSAPDISDLDSVTDSTESDVGAIKAEPFC
mmetsp:Transcript_9986/g.28177  ORF Transcript_9986/g.28177 Transcript_9986/m.28177 type:complete len:256 (-) Transcript_9986:62-829(-)